MTSGSTVSSASLAIASSAARYTLKSGDVHIFNPKDPHRIQSHVPGSLILTVQLELSYYEKSLRGLKEGYFLCDTCSSRDLSDNDLRLLRFYLAKLYGQYTKGNSDLALEECARKTLQLLLAHFRQYTYTAEESNPAAIVRLQNQKQFYRDYERMYRSAETERIPPEDPRVSSVIAWYLEECPAPAFSDTAMIR